MFGDNIIVSVEEAAETVTTTHVAELNLTDSVIHDLQDWSTVASPEHVPCAAAVIAAGGFR